MVKDPRNLLYGPRKNGPGPKNWVDESLVDLYEMIDEEADTQWKECAVEAICSEMGITKEKFFDQDPEVTDSLIQLQYDKPEFPLDNSLLETKMIASNHVEVYLTPRWSLERLVLVQAERRLEKGDIHKAWTLWGTMHTRDEKQVGFEAKGFKDLLREIDQESLLLDTLAYSRDIDALTHHF